MNRHVIGNLFRVAGPYGWPHRHAFTRIFMSTRRRDNRERKAGMSGRCTVRSCRLVGMVTTMGMASATPSS